MKNCSVICHLDLLQLTQTMSPSLQSSFKFTINVIAMHTTSNLVYYTSGFVCLCMCVHERVLVFGARGRVREKYLHQRQSKMCYVVGYVGSQRERTLGLADQPRKIVMSSIYCGLFLIHPPFFLLAKAPTTACNMEQKFRASNIFLTHFQANKPATNMISMEFQKMVTKLSFHCF